MYILHCEIDYLYQTCWSIRTLRRLANCQWLKEQETCRGNFTAILQYLFILVQQCKISQVAQFLELQL